MEAKLELEREREATLALPGKDVELSFNDDDEEKITFTDEQLIQMRADEILKTVWIEYDTRMLTKSTSKAEFLDNNKEKAYALATTEFEADRIKKQEQMVNNEG